MSSIAPNKLNVFVRGTDSAFHVRWFDGGWHGFVNFGGSWLYETVSISRKPGALSTFGVGVDSAIYHKHFHNGAWTDYVNIGGICRGLPAVSSRGNGTIDIFHIGRDYALYHKSWDGNSFSPYTKLASTGFIHNIDQFTRGLSAVSMHETRIDLFAIGINGRLYHGTWTSTCGWNMPRNIHESRLWNGIPKAISRSEEGIDLFCIGDDSTLYHLTFSSSTSTWKIAHTFSGNWPTDPEAISWGPNRIDLFMLGFDSATYHASWDGHSWSSWTSLGGICFTAPKAVSWSANRLDVFVTGIDGGLYHKWSTGDGVWFPSTAGGWEALGGVATSRAG